MPKTRLRRETAAEKLGYRWMMRLLRAMDAAGKKGRREAEVVVRAVGVRNFRGGYRGFVAKHRPAVKEALAMMHNGAMPAGVRYGKPAGSGRYSRSFTVTLSSQW